MAGTQPPISNWQPSATVPPPMQGAGFPPGYGAFPPARRRRPRRRALIAIAIAAVLLVAVMITGLVVGNRPKGSLVLPARLLGLQRATSAGARHLASQLKTSESAAGSKLSGVVAGVYGDPSGAWLAISGGGICGTCSAKSASTQRHNLTASGYQDATSFPGGTEGGVLACGSRASQGSTLIRCTWVDGQTAGNMIFAGGAAVSLTDAAAKTNRARTAVEH